MEGPCTSQLAAALSAPPPGPLCVGFSGGLDSTVLLHALATDPGLRARGLRALHVDHGLDPASADWAAHCARACAELAVPLLPCRVRVDAAKGTGLEAAARAARYRAFEAALQPGEVLALAHHRDDQVETLLLRLLRGSGSAGLSGMAPRRRLGDGLLWRPLLELPRTVLHGYAAEHALRWIEDPANAGLRHDRNLLRHAVLPVLRQRWPGTDAAIARSARLLREDAARLRDVDCSLLATAQGADPATLSLPALQAMSAAERRAVLRLWLPGRGLPSPPAAVIDRFDAEFLQAREDATPCLRWAGAELRRHRGRVHAMPPLPATDRNWTIRWDGRAPVQLPAGFGSLALHGDAPAVLDFPLTIRPRAGGERIQRPGRTHHESLKHVLQQLGVPPWTRDRLPLLFAPDSTLLAAGDLLHTTAWQQWAGDLRLHWQR